jgi:hypothetical protein
MITFDISFPARLPLGKKHSYSGIGTQILAGRFLKAGRKSLALFCGAPVRRRDAIRWHRFEARVPYPSRAAAETLQYNQLIRLSPPRSRSW